MLAARRVFVTVPARTLCTAAAADVPADKILLNFAVPSRALVSNKVAKRVTVPGRGGTYGIEARSPPSVSELRPGVVSVEYGEETERFFVAGGYAFTHKGNKVEIAAVEGGPVSAYDADAVRAKYDELKTALDTSAGNPKEQAKAKLGLEVLKSLAAEMDIKL